MYFNMAKEEITRVAVREFTLSRSQTWITQHHVSKQFLPYGFLICVSFSIANVPHILLGCIEILEGPTLPALPSVSAHLAATGSQHWPKSSLHNTAIDFR